MALLNFKLMAMNVLKLISKYSFSLLLIPLVLGGKLNASTCDAFKSKWHISWNKKSKRIDILKKSTVILSNISVRFNNDGVFYDSSEYTNVEITEKNEVDSIGLVHKYVIHYKKDNVPSIEQVFYFYPRKDYFLTEVYLISTTGKTLSTNYIAPVYTTESTGFLPKSDGNRMLFIPFDNDGFITYGSLPLSRSERIDDIHATGELPRDTISFEVTSIFDGNSQKGLVIGSIEHDTWKSAIRMTGSGGNRTNVISKLECYCGVSHSMTRDELEVEGRKVLKPHGCVKGMTVKSVKMFIGLFDDWRLGMEEFGRANTMIVPKCEWTKGTPYGWNSWGGMSTHVNYEGACSASDFVKEHLQGKGGFGTDGVIFVGLDSYWDNLSWEQLENFARRCVANGQIPGIYWTPFNDWFPESERDIEGGNGCKYSQTHLKVNGYTKKLYGVGCMDPTSPGTLSRIDYFIDKFKAVGFKYLKLDFLTAGMIEADSWYNKDITTGTQAFNCGMKYLRERCGNDMFIVESISPLFPYQYANARRISCDAWGEMWHTNYMMNSLSYGWWLNHIYAYNDPDHLVLGDRSEAENKSRITTGAVTGYFMNGDNLSTKGNYVGSEAAQGKVRQFSVNERINKVVSLGKSFRPVYGHKVFGPNRAVDLFTLETEDAYYIAYFNYDDTLKEGKIILKDMGIDPNKVAGGIECWSGNKVNVQDSKLLYRLSAHQAEIYHLYKK